MSTDNTQKKSENTSNYNFDLSTMLSEQNSSRLTKTPPYILFENVMRSLMSKMNNAPANSNTPFTR